MSSNFKLHRLYSLQNNSTFRKIKAVTKEYKVTKKTKFQEVLSKRWKMVEQFKPEDIYSLDFLCEALEYRWLEEGITLFPDVGVCERLMGINFDHTDESKLDFKNLPFKCFQVSLPKHVLFGGVNVDAVIVNLTDCGSEIVSSFAEKVGLEVNNQASLKRLELLNKTNIIQFIYREPSSTGKKQSICMSSISEDNIGSALKDPEYSGQCEVGNRELNNQDKLTMDELNKFVLKLIIYLMNYPDAIEEGTAPLRLDTNPLNATKNTTKIIGGVLKGGLSGGVYRRAHFRNLRNDKYYKGEFADMEKGSRWVYVSEHEEIDPFKVKNFK